MTLDFKVSGLRALCPECGAVVYAKEGLIDDELNTYLFYECSKCGHEWTEDITPPVRVELFSFGESNSREPRDTE